MTNSASYRGLMLFVRVSAVLAIIGSLPAGDAGWAMVAWQENGVPVCAWAGVQESPYVAGVGQGALVVAWADARSGGYDIYAQKIDAEGHMLWSAGGVKVCGASYDQQFPAVVGDGAGGAIIVWQDGRIGDDGLDLYAQRVLASGAMAWQTDGVAVCSHLAGVEDPPLAFSHVVTGDGSGGVVVAWRDTRNDPVAGNTEIYVQRVNVSGVVQWTANGVKLLGFTTLKWATRNPIIAPDGSGGAVVAWQDARALASTANDLYAQHVSSTGAVTWTANGVAVCNAAGDQSYPDITALDSGSWVLVWEDKRSGNYDVYAQCLNPSGVAQWGSNGRLVCSSANDQRTPRVVSDSADGVVIAWTDKRSSTLYTDIYAQRLNASGSELWANQGSAVCTAAGSQTRVRMAPSVNNSTIMTWMDTRNEATTALYDIYGQMIGASAARMWLADGVQVGALTGNNQRMQQTSGDGEQSICAVWEDDRTGDWNVFAQKLSPWSPVAGIAELRSSPSGSALALPDLVVTGSFAGCFYVQESERPIGIRVAYADPPAVGSLVQVSGIGRSGREPWVEGYSVRLHGTDDVPRALGVTPWLLGSPLVGQVCGLSNVGLLVRTWGEVISAPGVGQPYMTLSDGARVLRVYSTSNVAPGDFVSVTGICAGDDAESDTAPAILTRDSSDVRIEHVH